MPTPLQPDRQPIDIVICCDGTNNTLTGGIEDTNVLLLYGYLLKHTDPARTLLYYDPGVGVPDAAPPTDLIDIIKRRVDRLSGLASGRGVYENIGEAYSFLMQHWRDEHDRIFCFGFSRGAFTARAVVGMVNMFGVIRPEHAGLLPTLVRIYFSQPAHGDQTYGKKSWQRSAARWLHRGFAKADKAGSEAARPSDESTLATRGLLAQQVRRNFGIDEQSRRASVHWVGVWDTVESVGLPVFFNRDNPATASFHDKPGIRNVRHALALDEHRWPFVPRLYDAPSEVQHGERTLKQLWFPGVHCDVGGSYEKGKAGLSDAALVWMVNEVAPQLKVPPLTKLPRTGQPLPYDDLGMPRRRGFPSTVPLRHDALWDTPLWVLAGMTVRDLRGHRVASNNDVEAAVAQGKTASDVGVWVDARAADVPALPQGPSVWDTRRAPWPVWLALACIVVGLVLSGRCMTGPNGEVAWGLNGDAPLGAEQPQASRPWQPWRHAPAAAANFANQQLATLAGGLPARWPHAHGGDLQPRGLHDRDSWDVAMARAPAWALFWDLFTIAGLAYLLSRLASRGFAWLAGYRHPGQKPPAWRFIGWLPLLAIAADVGENAGTALALLFHGLGSPLLTSVALFVMALLAWAKVVGYLVCAVVFVPLRLWIAVSPKQTVGKVGRSSDAGGDSSRVA